ncbi:MAG: gliding motility protein GldC [Bacteroidetes bacterium]|nr:gliding motility protein GldC [Bacteroidota bacterium]MDA0937337.1 gliding motility protein GldC [Bacteroidota bacterium]MDA1344795.1 gliding motility protein GldC [Bacteroidota bacterium]
MGTTKETPITIQVSLDENKIPEKIKWSAPDGGVVDEEAKAMLLALWDGEQQETLRMDLWVKDMPLDQMQKFFHQTLVTMSDTYYRATEDEKMTGAMKDFCDYFAKQLKLKAR